MPSNMRLSSLFAFLALSTPGVISGATTMHYGHDGKELPKVSLECEACGFSARAAREAYHGPRAAKLLRGDWEAVLAGGCEGLPGCDGLLRRSAKAMSGALMDFVSDGDDAEEWTLDLEDFQEALCATYGDACKASSHFSHVRSITLKAGRSVAPASVAVYKRGAKVAGMQPLEPAAVLAAGQSFTFTSKATGKSDLSLVAGYAFRLIPIAPLACDAATNEAHLFGYAPDSKAGRGCVVSCADPARLAAGTAKERKPAAHERDVDGCARASKRCESLGEDHCHTVQLHPSKTHAFLMARAEDWDSPAIVDVFADGDLEQVYEVEQRAEWIPDMPLKIPDPKAMVPDGWDDGEDGEWEPPLVKNTAALATNQRFTVAKADPAGLAAPAPAPLQRVFEDSGAARAEQSGEDLQTRMARAAARSGSGASGGGGGGNGGRSNQERPAAWDDEQDGVWEPGSGASKGKAKKANKGKKVKKPKKNPSTTGEL